MSSDRWSLHLAWYPAAAAGLLPARDSTSVSDDALLGAGSTFDYILFSKEFSEYNQANGLKVNYQSIGSGGGILQLTNKTVDFGASDAPMNGKQDSGAVLTGHPYPGHQPAP